MTVDLGRTARLYGRSRGVWGALVGVAVATPVALALQPGFVSLPWLAVPTPLAPLLPMAVAQCWTLTMGDPVGAAEAPLRRRLRALRAWHAASVLLTVVALPSAAAWVFTGRQVALQYAVAGCAAVGLVVLGVRWLPLSLAWAPTVLYVGLGLWWGRYTGPAAIWAAPVTGRVLISEPDSWLWAPLGAFVLLGWWATWRPGGRGTD